MTNIKYFSRTRKLMSGEQLLMLRSAGLDGVNLGDFKSCHYKLYNGQPVLVVWTGNGGNNRRCTEEEESPFCPCSGCIMTYAPTRFENYIDDMDWRCDDNYAKIYFSILPRYQDIVLELLRK